MFPVVCSISEKYRLSKKEAAVIHYLLICRDTYHEGKDDGRFWSTEGEGSWESPKYFSEMNVEFLLLWEQLKISRHNISHTAGFYFSEDTDFPTQSLLRRKPLISCA